MGTNNNNNNGRGRHDARGPSSVDNSQSGGVSVESSGAGSSIGASQVGSNTAGLNGDASSAAVGGSQAVPRPRWMGKRVGRFRLVGLLGQGAMGRVFRAEDTLMGRHVALKLLPRTLKTKAGASVGPEVLIREARAAAAIEHPNAVAVYEVNQAGDVCYVAMELLEGGSLRDLVRAAGPMDLTRACLLCAEAAEALAAAHAAGVVHRDVKPANLMLSRSGRCKVVDFGLARLDDAGAAATGGENVGTPQFIAPEILQGAAASPASDLYSLGGTLFYLLTGRPPFEARSARELLRMHVDAPVPDLRTFRPDAGHGLADAVAKALAKRPGDRWAGMEQFARVLRVHSIPTPVGAESSAVIPTLPTPTYFPPGSSSSIPSPGGASRSSRPATPMDAPLPAAELAEPQRGARLAAAAYLDRLNRIAPTWAWLTGGGVLVAILVGILCILLSRPAAKDVAANTAIEPPAQTPNQTATVQKSAPGVTPPARSSSAAAGNAQQAKAAVQAAAVAVQTQSPLPSAPAVPPAPAPLTVLPHTPMPMLKFGDFAGDMDIGDVRQKGLVNFDAPRHDYTVTGDGFDIYGKTDSFHFVYRKMTGDVTLKATIRFIGSSPARFRKAALIVRQSLAPSSSFADIVMHGEGSVGVQYRRAAGENAEQQATKTTGSTLWLVRHGDHFTGYLSSPGAEPQKVYDLDIPMSGPVYVGLGVSARDKVGDRPETANFASVELDATARIIQPE